MVYMPEVEEVNLYNVDKSKSESLLDNPQQILQFTKGFKYQLIGEIRRRENIDRSRACSGKQKC